MKIEGWRKKIDAVDAVLLRLLNRRAELALEVGRLKCEEGVAFRSPVREREIIARMKSLNPGPFDRAAVGKIYRLIVAECIRAQEIHCRAARRGARQSR
jgi:chorismate mutase-like protein